MFFQGEEEEYPLTQNEFLNSSPFTDPIQSSNFSSSSSSSLSSSFSLSPSSSSDVCSISSNINDEEGFDVNSLLTDRLLFCHLILEFIKVHPDIIFSLQGFNKLKKEQENFCILNLTFNVYIRKQQT